VFTAKTDLQLNLLNIYFQHAFMTKLQLVLVVDVHVCALKINIL